MGTCTYCMTWMWSRCGEEPRVTTKWACTKLWIFTEFDSSGCGNVLFWKYFWRVRFSYVFNMFLMTGQTGLPTWTFQLSVENWVQNWISRSNHEFRMWDVYWKLHYCRETLDVKDVYVRILQQFHVGNYDDFIFKMIITSQVCSLLARPSHTCKIGVWCLSNFSCHITKVGSVSDLSWNQIVECIICVYIK